MLLMLAMAVKLQPTQAGVDGPNLGLGQELAEVAKVEEAWYLDQTTYPQENRLAQTQGKNKAKKYSTSIHQRQRLMRGLLFSLRSAAAATD